MIISYIHNKYNSCGCDVENGLDMNSVDCIDNIALLLYCSGHAVVSSNGRPEMLALKVPLEWGHG